MERYFLRSDKDNFWFETDGITSEERKMLNDLLKRKNCGAVTFCDTRHINWQSFIKLYSREL